MALSNSLLLVLYVRGVSRQIPVFVGAIPRSGGREGWEKRPAGEGPLYFRHLGHITSIVIDLITPI